MATTPKIGLKIPSTADNIAEQINIDTPNNLGIIDTEIDEIKTQLNSLNAEVDTHLAEDVTDEDTPHGIMYEEGAWTPSLIMTGGSYALQEGRYIKINKVVHIWGKITLSTLGTSASPTTVQGLPFVVNTVGGGFATIQYWGITLPANSFTLIGGLTDNRIVVQAQGSHSSVTNLQFSTLSDTASIRVYATYKV